MKKIVAALFVAMFCVLAVQAVMAEIGDEKIDIVLWDADPKAFITNALAPAKVREVELNEAIKSAKIKVDSDQLSLAIGKGGQNVRLASKLSGYQIEVDKEGMPPLVPAKEEAPISADIPLVAEEVAEVVPEVPAEAPVEEEAPVEPAASAEENTSEPPEELA